MNILSGIFKRKKNEGDKMQGQTLNNTYANNGLLAQLVQECTAMAKHAFASGVHVPGNIIQTLEKYTAKTAAKGNGTEEIQGDVRPLISVHHRLAKIVEPAKPRTISLMEEESQRAGILKFLGAVPFIRSMMLAALICLVLFVSISLSPHINNKPESWDLFRSSGWQLLLKELFLLSAAGLGASFTALFRANRYIIEGTFDPKYESSYWIRFSLGFIAGMILATLIPIEEQVRADFGKPLLAMLGGFSADLVYRVISRVIETLESLFRGDTKNQVRAEKEQARARAAEEDMQNRFKVASNLMKVQQEIGSGLTPEQIKKKMGQLMDDMVGVDTQDELIK
jgi:hypothetical protein